MLSHDIPNCKKKFWFSAKNFHFPVIDLQPPEFRKIRRQLRGQLRQRGNKVFRVERRLLRRDHGAEADALFRGLKADGADRRGDVALPFAALRFFADDDLLTRKEGLQAEWLDVKNEDLTAMMQRKG